MNSSTIEDRLNEFNAFRNAIENQKGHDSEVAQVLITASYLDNQLLIILKAFVVSGSKKYMDSLFEGPKAPMGSFSSRTQVAFSLGLITARERDSLDAIRSIRNRFAHKITASFNDTELTSHFDKLAWVAGRDKVDQLDRSEVLFLGGIRLGVGFTNRSDHVAAERRVTKEWPDHRIDATMDPDFDPIDQYY